MSKKFFNFFCLEKIWTLSAIVTMFSCLLLFYENWHAGTLDLAGFINSDSVHLHVLFTDLSLGGNYFSWTHPSVTFALPDYALYFFSWALTKSVDAAFLLNATLQLVACTLALFLIFRERYPSSIATLFAIAWVPFLLELAPQSSGIFSIALLPIHHFGTLIFILIGCWRLIIFLKNPKNALHFWLLFVVSCLAVFSDKIFLVQFIAPVLLVSGYLYFRGNVRLSEFKRTAYCLLSSAALGLLLLKLVPNSSNPSTSFGLSHFKVNVVKFIDSLSAAYQNDIFYVALLTFFIAGLVTLFFGFSATKRYIRNGEQVFLSFLVIFFVIFGNLVVALSVGLEFAPRYALPLYFFPLWLVTPIGFELFRKASPEMSRALPLGFAIWAFIALSHSAPSLAHATFPEYYPRVVECVDEHIDLTLGVRGISGYWDAKLIQALSKRGAVIAQFKTPGLTEDRWQTNLDFFKMEYDFVISDPDSRSYSRIDLEKIREINGEGLIMKSCGDRVLAFYPSKKILVR